MNPIKPCCPIHHEPLVQSNDELYISDGHGEKYPIVEGIPILIADHMDRQQVAKTNWSQQDTTPAKAVDFYNRSDHHDQYCRKELDDTLADIKRWVDVIQVDGPALEIGSGKGPLQGVGGQYVALDYSFTALRKYISPAHQRICASAEAIPFPDNTFRFVFSIAALEHVPNADKAFEEIDRVLKPGGIAYLHPAWHCVQYNCEGIPVRPYRDLNFRQKLVKLSLLVRKHRLAKAMGALPGRVLRRLTWATQCGPSSFRFTRLRPDYDQFWLSDSDAASRLDSHEACLFFHSRGYRIHRPGSGTWRQLLAKHEPVVVEKRAE